MSILNLEVKIRKVKIKTCQNNGICFSLRLGRILSSLSTIINNKIDEELQTNIDVTVGCEEAVLASNSRASLVIYEALSDQKREIVGMVFIMLKNQQFQVQRYKIQQSSDPDSFIQLSFSITTIQLKQKQNQSLASKSSLAEIKELHRALTRGHKKSASDLSYEEDQLKKSRLSPQDKQRQLRHLNSNKIPHLKSQESCPFANDEETYAITIKKLSNQLTKERERNSILINLLVVEEEKNTESENYIKRIISYIQNANRGEQQDITFFQEQKHNQILKSQEPSQIQSKKKQPANQQKTGVYSSKEMETIIKERDELYTISHELYEKTKTYKIENQELFKNVKSIQHELKQCVQEIKHLREQNLDLKKQLFQLADKKQSLNYNQVKEENDNLKIQNAEYERKFKESFRAIEEFKNDAWKAQEQVIKKDQQIGALKEELESLKCLNEGNTTKLAHYENNSLEMSIDQRQSAKMAVETFKLMSALLMKNNLEKQKILDKLSENREEFKKDNSIEVSKIVERAKQAIEKIYQNLLKENKKMIHILQMKRKINEALNAID